MKCLFLAAIIAVALAVPNIAQSTDKKKGGSDTDLTQTLMALTRQEDEAEMKRDTATVSLMLADDFVVTRPDGARVTKADYVKVLAQMPESEMTVKGYNYEDFKVHRYGDTAVANYVLTMIRRGKDGKDESERLRPTVVWVKQNGTWRVVTFCATPIKEPPTKE